MGEAETTPPDRKMQELRIGPVTHASQRHKIFKAKMELGILCDAR